MVRRRWLRRPLGVQHGGPDKHGIPRSMPQPPTFTCVAEPWQGQDVALIHAVLSGTGINYYIENEHYGRGGPAIGDGYMRLMVETGRAEEARELLERESDTRER